MSSIPRQSQVKVVVNLRWVEIWRVRRSLERCHCQLAFAKSLCNLISIARLIRSMPVIPTSAFRSTFRSCRHFIAMADSSSQQTWNGISWTWSGQHQDYYYVTSNGWQPLDNTCFFHVAEQAVLTYDQRTDNTNTISTNSCILRIKGRKSRISSRASGTRERTLEPIQISPPKAMGSAALIFTILHPPPLNLQLRARRRRRPCPTQYLTRSAYDYQTSFPVPLKRAGTIH